MKGKAREEEVGRKRLEMRTQSSSMTGGPNLRTLDPALFSLLLWKGLCWGSRGQGDSGLRWPPGGLLGLLLGLLTRGPALRWPGHPAVGSSCTGDRTRMVVQAAVWKWPVFQLRGPLVA